MAKELNIKTEKGQNANYQIIIELSPDDQDKLKENTYTQVQKTYKKDGFRVWHVPLDIIKKEVNPTYLEVEILENIVNKSLQQTLDENKEIRWIGQPYNLDKKQEWDKTIITYTLDYYPEVIEKNNNYKTIKISKIDDKITSEDIKVAMQNLAREYATYDPSEKSDHDTTDRLLVKYINKDGQNIHSKTIFTEHQDKHDPFFKVIEWKSQWDTVSVDYKNVPEKLIYTWEGDKPEKIELQLTNIVKEKLPTIDDDRVKEKFGNEWLSDTKTLEQKISDQMKDYKSQNELIRIIDEYINSTKESFEIQIPKTMVESEYENRYNNYIQRFGSKENFEKTVLADPKGKDMIEKLQSEIRTASKTSLEKFFIFQKLIDILGIKDVKRDQELDAETKLYEHLIK